MIFRGRKKKKSVSIVMRTRNRPVFLRRAFGSVLEQTFSDWNLVLVNDGGERALIREAIAPLEKEFSSRLLVVDFPKTAGTGIGAPLNFGFVAADSEFIVVHDDDDTWHPDFLQECVAVLRDPLKGLGFGACAVKTNLIREKVDGQIICEQGREIFNEWQGDAVSLFRLAESNTLAPISLMFRRSVLREIGSRRDDLGPLEDWEFNLRLFSRFPVAFIPRLLANYHLRVPESSQGTDANFFASSSALYGKLDIEIRNELLRKDIAEGKMGLGFLVAMSHSHGHLFQKMHAMEGAVRGLK